MMTLLTPSRQSTAVVASVCIFVLICIFIFYKPAYNETHSGGISLRVLLKHPLASDDINLIARARTLLWPPSHLPYNLSKSNQTYYYEDNGTIPVVHALFKNKKSGVFIEAGAFNGETLSQTLYLERFLGWTGLLVEPNTQLLQIIKQKHRKVYVYPGCLSPKPYPEQVEFMELSTLSHIKKMSDMTKKYKYYKCKNYPLIVSIPKEDELRKEVKKMWGGCNEVHRNLTSQCVPLYTLLLALNMNTVDWLSLDVEGAEAAVLSTIPFHKVHIKVIRVEIMLVNRDRVRDVMLSTNIYKELMEFKNRSLVDEVTKGDMWFARRDFEVGSEFS